MVLHFKRTTCELTPFGVKACPTFHFDKILDQRSTRGITEELVQWKGWDHSYNSWLPRSYIQEYYGHPRYYFYVTVFSNGSKEVFPENILTAFTIQLAQPVDLGLSDWEVGLAELSYKTPHPKLFKGKCVDVNSSERALV